MKSRLVLGDITALDVDAIVNPANSSLLGGGGVDGAIHAKAGEALLRECMRLRKGRYPNGLPTGQAVLTSAYNLPCRYVIHTVGPVNGRDDLSLLADCYANSLRLADGKRCRSVAFPAISAGAFGVPIAESARVAHGAVSTYDPVFLEEAVLVLHSRRDYDTYKKEFNV